ncbi:phospholipase D family protein [Ornithinimicrobium sp. LYQ121]|uniref:phospholipase D family protein n=1 Tax=Ornithinimicrobium sp. LYQ121 TaxID=3378801 RepID=UPI003854A94D
MLEPTGRHLFVDGLRPPPGYRVDLAVGTTYTLGLGTLLLPPLAMAAHDRTTTNMGGEEDEGQPTSIALLEAVRRLAGRTTVFCHTGGIHVPGHYRRILTFAEDSVVEVLPSAPGRTFHPKLWALRFTDGRSHRHRLLVLSRNLTADTSWDTILQLEEDEKGRIDGAPAADFLQHLPGLARTSLPGDRAEQLRDLADTLRDTRFAVPSPFTHGELWPLGAGTEHGWPIPRGAGSSVVISPFLDRTTVDRVPKATRSVFVSRPDTFEELGGAAFETRQTLVLDPLAEQEQADDRPEEGAPWEVRSGLHAKTFVWDYDGSGWCLTGSANATTAAFGGNVEFSVLLRGPRGRCGVDALLPIAPQKGEVTLARVLTPFAIANLEPRPDVARGAELDIAAYHAALATAGPVLTAQQDGQDERYDVRLSFTGSVPEPPGPTTVRILSRTAAQHARAIDAAPTWTDIPLADLTPFIAISTQVALPGSEPVRVECVLKAELEGVAQDRAAHILRGLLSSEQDVLRYLAYLLDDSGGAGLGLDGTGEGEGEPGTAGPTRPTYDGLALLETLVRAAGRGDESLSRVHALMKDLRDENGRSPVISADFLAVWESVWAAVDVEGQART